MEEPDEEIAELASRVFNLAREGNTDDLMNYIEAGLSPDLANQNGDSLLMLAAYHGHRETVQALLNAGADPNRLNDRDQSPFAGAVFRDELEVIELLVERGADASIGRPSARETAAMFQRQDLLKRLV